MTNIWKLKKRRNYLAKVIRKGESEHANKLWLEDMRRARSAIDKQIMERKGIREKRKHGF